MNVVLEAHHAMTSMQLGIWALFEPPADPGQSSGGGLGHKAPLSSRAPTPYISQKYTLVVHLQQ